MNREVEERIVAMYFDNEDFEKNAKTTINTLGQLKEGLNLEDSAKGFSVFEKLGKTLNFEKANTSLNKMKLNLSNIGNTFKKAFSIGKQPLDEAEGFLKHLNGYITKYIGFDVAGKIVHGLENSIRSLTVAPVTAGWHQYESTMDSIKTIMSSTGESIDVVKEHLASMTDYANKTIYSLTDMTSNLGKFTNNGVELERSVKAMEGIANATADAGQGAQQASMAMYNVSQAIGVGKMTTIDWKSLENANIATQKLKKTFLEMAALQGRIEKKTDGRGMVSYMLTKDDDGKELKESIELTTANFREYLSKGWLDKETMLRAFEVYSGQVDQLTLERWGIHDKEQQKYFIELGQDALEAATQVRTFTKMMDALKESAQSGWAKTFELIFGDMNQGTTLWTTINNILDEILSKSAEARNNMFEIWSGKEIDTSENENKLNEVEEQITNAKSRLDALLETATSEGIQKTIDKDLEDIARIKKEIEDLKAGDQWDKDSLIASREKKIQEMEKNLKNLEKKRDDLAKEEQKQTDRTTKKNEYQAQIDQYDQELYELKRKQGANRDREGNVANADREKQLAKAIKDKEAQIQKIQEKIRKLDAESESSEVEKIRKEIEELEKQQDRLNKEIDRAKNTAKSSLVDEQGRTGREILIDALLGTEQENGERVGGLLNLFRQIGSAISDAFGDVFGRLDAEGLFKFSQKVEQFVKKISEWFGDINNEGSRLSKLQKILKGFFSVIKAVFNVLKAGWNLVKKLVSPIVDFVINALSGVYDFFVKMGDMNLGEMLTHLGDGLKNVWEKIKTLFTAREILDENGNPTGETEIPILRWLSSIWEGVKATVRQWAEDNGLGDVWAKISGWWSTIADLFEQGKAKVLEAYESVKKWWEDNGFSKFFTDLWTGITELFIPKTGMRYNGSMLEEYTEDAPIVTFFKNIWKGIGDAFNDVKEWWEKDELGIRAFFQDIWDSIANIFTPKRIEGKQGNSWTEDMPIVAFFKNMWNGVEEVWGSVKAFWDEDKLGIKSFFQGIWDFIANIFTPKRIEGKQGNSWTEDMPIVAFFKNIWNGVEEVWTSVTDWWEKDELGIRAFFQGVWDSIAGWFTPEKDTEGNVIGDSPIVAFFNNIWNGVETAFNEVKVWWENDELGIKSFFQGVWESVSGIFKPKTGMRYNGSMLEEYTEDAPIVSFLKNMWTSVQNIWGAVSTWPGWEKIGQFFSDIWQWISDNFNVAVEWATVKQDKYGGKTGFQQFLEDAKNGIGQAWEFLKTEIPWKEIGEFFTDIWNWIAKIFTGEEEVNNKASSGGPARSRAAAMTGITYISDVGNGMIKKVDELPQDEGKTSKALEVFHSIIDAISGFFTGIIETVKGWEITESVTNFLTNMGDFLKGTLDIVGQILGSIGRVFEMITGNRKWDDKQSWKDLITLALPALIAIIGYILEFRRIKNLSNISGAFGQSFGLQFLEICGGLFLAASAIAMLTAVDTPKMLVAGGVVVVLAAVIGKILKSLADKNNGIQDQAVTSGERILTKLIGAVEKIGMVAVALALLPNIIKTIGEVEKDLGGNTNLGDDVLKVLLGVVTLIGGISIVMALVQKITGNNGLDPGATGKTVLSLIEILGGLLVFTLAIGGIGEAVDGIFGEGSHEAVLGALQKAGDVMKEFGNAIGSFFMGLFGIKSDTEKADEAMAITEKLSEFSNQFTSQQVSGITRMITLISNLSSDAMNVDTGKMAAFATALGSLGDGIYEIAGYIAEVEGPLSELHNPESIQYRKLMGFSDVVKAIADAITPLGNDFFRMSNMLDRVEMLAQEENLVPFVQNLNRIIAELGNLDGADGGIKFDGLEIAKKLYEAVQEGLVDKKLPSFDATSIIDAIILALTHGKTAIAQLVHEMVQSGIDLSGSTGEDGIGGFTLPDNLMELLNYGQSGEGSKGITSMTDLISNFMGDESAWSELSSSFGLKEEELNGLLSGFGDNLNSGEWLKVTDPDTGEETDIATMIQGKLGDLQSTINETSFEVHITPVFDFQNLTAESLMSQLGLHSVDLPVGIDTGELKVSFTGLSQELKMDDVLYELRQIYSQVGASGLMQARQIDALSTHMDGIANEVSRLKLYLDGKTLVGGIINEIDAQLYDLANTP